MSCVSGADPGLPHSQDWRGHWKPQTADGKGAAAGPGRKMMMKTSGCLQVTEEVSLVEVEHSHGPALERVLSALELAEVAFLDCTRVPWLSAAGQEERFHAETWGVAEVGQKSCASCL